ncbi:MAG: hypothetical protein WBO89_09320, partial [Propionicimonas sp.]
RQLAPQLRDDPHTPVLAGKLAALANQGENVDRLLKIAMSSGPLPDEHAAAALQYRVEHPRTWPPAEVWETVTSPRLVGRPGHLRPPGHRPPPGPGIGF